MARIEEETLKQLSACPYFRGLRDTAEKRPNTQWENCIRAGCDLGVTYDDQYGNHSGAFYVEGSCPRGENPS